MRYLALACDYDGTLAHHGKLDDVIIDALERIKKSGRKLLLVTGRQLDDLKTVCPRLDLFDRIVAENGALLVRTASKEEVPLAEAPPASFAQALRDAGVPVSTGHVIVATWTPHEATVLHTIKKLGLELQIIFNKGAVMVLPAGVNKASGLKAALDELGLSAHNCVGVGDAENDHAFLAQCEVAVAVQNALPSLRERADVVTGKDHGAGVAELIEEMLATDLASLEPRLSRHHIPVGDDVDIAPYGRTVLVAGSSGGGKTTLVTALLERIVERGYQFVIVDPEGDYAKLEGAVALGDPAHAPTVSEVLELLSSERGNASVNLLGLALAERPAFLESLLPRLVELRATTGRPHFVVIDEAHHMLPKAARPNSGELFLEGGVILVTVHPDEIARSSVARVDDVIVVGATPQQTLSQAAAGIGVEPPHVDVTELATGEALVWSPRVASGVKKVLVEPPKAERFRHRRKYAEGELGPDKSFYFRGPEEKLNLRAQNLITFVRLADGVDDDTWEFHRRQHDYSKWFREAIKDEALASAAADVENDEAAAPADSRAKIAHAINERYTLPATT